MTTLATFFKESVSTLGVFYPNDYVIVTFHSFATAEDAVHLLRKEGFCEDDVLAIPGSGILEFFAEFRANSGLWAGVMEVVSRAFGTEQIFADNDVERARAGAGFLAIHCSNEVDKLRIQALLVPLQPVAMHWYRPGGIELLS